jgi:hypothetical protein
LSGDGRRKVYNDGEPCRNSQSGEPPIVRGVVDHLNVEASRGLTAGICHIVVERKR